MKKIICMSVAALSVTSVWASESFDEAFKNGDISGKIRLGYIQNSPDKTGEKDTDATAVGGGLKYETGDYMGLRLGAAAYISQRIHSLSGDHTSGELNTDFFDDQGDSFTYIGEAYINYKQEDLNLRIGRQQIDTPLADTDDIRMHPNTFEALMATYGGIEKTSLTLGYLDRWAGFDSGGDISKFKELSGANSDGTLLLGVSNESVENLSLQGWYYDSDKLMSVIYLEAGYGMEIGQGLNLETGAQYAYFGEDAASGVEGSVFGLTVAVESAPASISAAYNKASSDDGKAVSNGFGGGPFFTSMGEMTIDGLNDAEAFTVGVEVDFADYGAKGFVAGYAYGEFEGSNGANPKSDYKEHDFVLTYAHSETLDIEMSYADVKDKTNPAATSDGYSQFLTRVSYNF